MAERVTRQLRCAVYTRKSTEDGLEQDFNSLDAQREACEAYVLSQRHEGWMLVPGAYDDGGLSGGTLQRPALQQLLAEVEAGAIDVIVVYKVDRLTRSLADFAKIVELLDAKEASFVSVTQAFNTTSSMGRLTLNVLLSFAQFEREVTAERIRDKIAASKAKGIWMGGPLPLGYEVTERKLSPIPEEAQTVRTIFEQYLELGSVGRLVDRLIELQIVSKVRRYKSGRVTGGTPMAQGALTALLRNAIYIGKIVHKGTVHEGQHDGIVEPELFDTVQKQLEANNADKASGKNWKAPSLLLGLLFDTHGRKMTAGHATKRKRRYRYYLTHRVGVVPDGPPIERIPAHDIEGIVRDRLVAFLEDRSALLDTYGAQNIEVVTTLAKKAREKLTGTSASTKAVFGNLIQRIDVRTDAVAIAMNERSSLGEALSPQILTTPAVKVRAGKQTKMVVQAAGAPPPRIDRKLVKLLHEAIAVRDMLALADAAEAIGISPAYTARKARIGWLAPGIVSAIVEGRQPASLTRRVLSQASNIPLDWNAQRQVLGFDAVNAD
ncbi:MAG: recombinase family protein [Pontixanthobacter sp.]